MKNVEKIEGVRQQQFGITLVALVVTIILLLILAGISISQLTGSGLFEKARLAKEKHKSMEQNEIEKLSKYENILKGEIQNTRDSNIIKKSLINKEDGLYNKIEGGYIFNTSTTYTNLSTNNIIKLLSVKEYDYIIFEFDTYNGSSYINPVTLMLSIDQINMNQNYFCINNLGNASWNRIDFVFSDYETIKIYATYAGHSNYKKIRVADIKGIKL